MCGFTGALALSEQGRAYLQELPLSLQTLIPRGPDHQATFFHENVALGHARLKIIDLSPAAHQPFFSKDQRYVIVYNGEIYNFRELRKELSARGILFNTESDTEVLLELFIQSGPSCLLKLNGFFAFCIYDKQNGSLFLARDRYGIKPLHIYTDEHVMLFASELKAIMAYSIPREPDWVSVYNYFQFNYIPQPWSVLQNVRKLPPGNWLKTGTWEHKDHKSQFPGLNYQEHSYYDISQPGITNHAPSYEESKSRLAGLIDESVKSRLISDVPLGAFLSGGLDSSIIVSVAAKYQKHLNTFTVGFKDQVYFDESRYAEMVAKKYQTNHLNISLDKNALFDILFDVLDSIDEPFADSSAIAVYLLSKEVKKHVTVALSGDGADEVFGGYLKHTAESMIRKQLLIRGLALPMKIIAGILPKSRHSLSGNLFRQIYKLGSVARMNKKERYWNLCSIRSEKEIKSFLLQSFNEDTYNKRKSEILQPFEHDRSLNTILIADQKLVLPADMLTKVDLMSMAHALEIRNPFLDHKVVDFADSLPADFKIHGKLRKRILRDAYKDDLPAEILTRPKHGFEVPLLEWFRTEWRDLILNDLLDDSFIAYQGVFNRRSVENLKKRLFSRNPGDIQAITWSMIVFQHWWKKYIES